MVDKMKYAPDEIQEPWEDRSYLFPFEGAFGNRSWELVASCIISASQRKGHWVSLVDFHSDYDTKGMIKAGLLEPVYRTERKEWSAPTSASEKLKKIGVILTEKAVEKLIKKYPAGGLQPEDPVPDEAQTEEVIVVRIAPIGGSVRKEENLVLDGT